MARIEFLACREEIEELLAKGYDKRKIYTELTEKGRITMSYDALCKVMLKATRNDLRLQSIAAPAAPTAPAVSGVSPAVKPPASRPSQPNVIKAPSDELQDPRTIDPKSVF